MSIVDALKKLAVKLDVAETPEEIYAPDIVTALKQIAVGYEVADDPSEVPGSAIDEVIDVIAEKITPGGGNPNSEEVINGTLANPFGDHSIAELVDAISQNNATVKIAVSMGSMAGVLSILANVQFTQLYSSSCDVTVSGGSATVTMAVFLSYLDEEGITNADVIIEGQYLDLVPQADQMSTETTITWHPMPK